MFFDYFVFVLTALNSNLTPIVYDLVGNGTVVATKIGKIVTVRFENANSSKTSIGNVCALRSELLPPFSVYGAVNNNRNIGISNNGYISLYSNDMGAFVSGTFFGSVTYCLS